MDGVVRKSITLVNPAHIQVFYKPAPWHPYSHKNHLKWQAANQVDNRGRKVQKLYRKLAPEAAPGTQSRKTCFPAELFQSSLFIWPAVSEKLVFRLKTPPPPETGCNTTKKADYKSELGVWQHLSHLSKLKLNQKPFHASHDCL